MERLEARLVQYRALVDHRLHFGRLYFQVVGTNLTLITVAAIAIGIGCPEWWTITQLLAGLVLMGTGFVAHRLHHQEERFASAMQAIEKEESGMVQISDTRRFGARHVVVIALVGTGLLIGIQGVLQLIQLFDGKA